MLVLVFSVSVVGFSISGFAFRVSVEGSGLESLGFRVQSSELKVLRVYHQPPEVNYFPFLAKLISAADSALGVESAGETNLCESLDVVDFWSLVVEFRV